MKASGAYLALPLWGRFTLALLVAGVLVVALVIYVDAHNTDSQTSTNVAAAVQANRDAEILIAQDQAPHTVRLATGQSPTVGLTRAVRARLATLIASGTVSGPLERAHCGPTSRAGSRRGFSCSVQSGSVTYPFLGVVDTTQRRITFCKRDPPPVASDSVPVSARCRI